MNDYTYLRGKHEEEEGDRKPLIKRDSPQPEEAKALLETMKKIALNIENVSIQH